MTASDSGAERPHEVGGDESLLLLCELCAGWGVDPSFDELRDEATGELYERSEMRLETPVAPYDRDLDQEHPP